MIPEFETTEIWPNEEQEAYRVLPSGAFECTEQDIRERFGIAFPNSQTRASIVQGLVQLRIEAASHGFRLRQWINGSFVSSKEEPSDVDIVSFVDYDFYNSLPVSSQEFAKTVLAGGENSKLKYNCHAFAVLACQPGHAYFSKFEANRLYWLNLWGHARPDRETGRTYPKGFLTISLGSEACPIISTSLMRGE